MVERIGKMEDERAGAKGTLCFDQGLSAAGDDVMGKHDFEADLLGGSQEFGRVLVVAASGANGVGAEAVAYYYTIRKFPWSWRKSISSTSPTT